MIKPLVILYGYKELHNASAQIARTFWEHIPETEFNPTIVCGRGDLAETSKWPTFEVKENKFLHILWGFFNRIGLVDLNLVPDRYLFSWYPFVLLRVKQEIKKNKYDYIHAISNPSTDHLLGLKLKKITGLPLVVQCNDPWHDNSNKTFIFNLFRRIDLKLERNVAIGADLIIHSNKVIADIWAERYGDGILDKMVVIPFSFNVFNLPQIVPHKEHKDVLKIAHIGNIYSSRSSMTVFHGLEQFAIEHKELSNRIQLDYVGSVHKSEIEYVLKSPYLSQCVRFHGSLPPETLNSYYDSADIFLIIDVVLKRNSNYPSKLMLYYYYRKPILGITTKGSNLEQELSESGHSIVYYNESDMFSKFLYKAVVDYNSLLNFNKDYWQRHSLENVRNKYIMAIRNII